MDTATVVYLLQFAGSMVLTLMYAYLIRMRSTGVFLGIMTVYIVGVLAIRVLTSPGPVVRFIISVLATFVIPLLCSQERLGISALKCALLELCAILVDTVAMGLYTLMTPGEGGLPSNLADINLGVYVFTWLICLVLDFAVLCVLAWVFKRSANTAPAPLMAFMLLQFLLYTGCYFLLSEQLFANPTLLLTPVVLAALLAAADFALLFRVKSSHLAQERLTRQRALENEQAQWDHTSSQLQERMVFIRRIRHDLANMLTTASTLEKVGNPQLALSGIHQLQESVKRLRAEAVGSAGAVSAPGPISPKTDSVAAPAAPDAGLAPGWATRPLFWWRIFGAFTLAITVLLVLFYVGVCVAGNYPARYLTTLVALGAATVAAEVFRTRWALRTERAINATANAAQLQDAQAAAESGRALVEQQRQQIQLASSELLQALDSAEAALSHEDYSLAEHSLEQGLTAFQGVWLASTGIPSLDALLWSKANSLKELGIGLQVNASALGNVPMRGLDVISVTGNLIDNATHGALEVGGGTIELDIFTAKGQLFMETRNPCRADLSGPVPISSNPQDLSAEHGWGSGIVDSIARRCGGTAAFTAENGQFTATFMVPLSKEEPPPEEIDLEMTTV
ncbi:MAG: GHKL domain-containing protein [Coriobacteriia bacterium]|nr:GHKL domain-containing protein [Coriobacteriia bacterium]